MMTANGGREMLGNYRPLKWKVTSLHGFHKIIWDQQCVLQLGWQEKCKNRSITFFCLFSRKVSRDLKCEPGMKHA